MSKVIIKATSAGFFNSSPLGDPLAPNVFLKTDVNIDGLITSTSTGWGTSESRMYESFGIDVITLTSPPASARLGTQIQIDITGFIYFRMENGEKVVTAKMELPTLLSLTATYDQISADTYGWRAEAGDVLENILQYDGFLFRGGSGNDIFAPHSTILPAYADNIIRGLGGDDQLTGGLGDDKIKGGTGDDVLYDPDGTNLLCGQSGNDILRLGDGSNYSVAKGGHGDDLLMSGAGSDILRGGAGDDRLDGGRGDDRLYGGNGDDILSGGAGSDFLKGHRGADQFVFNTEDQGQDLIADFTDEIDLIVLSGVTDFNDLTITQQGNDTLVNWAGDSDLTLINFDGTLLGAEDFIFI